MNFGDRRTYSQSLMCLRIGLMAVGSDQCIPEPSLGDDPPLVIGSMRGRPRLVREGHYRDGRYRAASGKRNFV
jgi:hypothetical protein